MTIRTIPTAIGVRRFGMTKTFPRIGNFLRSRRGEARHGYGDFQIYEEMGKGKFPKQIPLGPNRVAWLEDEILEWQKARIAERNDPAVTAAKAKRTARRFRAGVTD